jgi:hypothetical protein
MKMDAMQKRRMWKVALVHFALTVFVWLGWEYLNNNEANYIQSVLWADSWRSVFFILQPLIWLVFAASQIGFINHFYDAFSDGMALAICLPLIPFWSFCFGWFYVKFTNRLNHFPVLGKKVF